MQLRVQPGTPAQPDGAHAGGAHSQLTQTRGGSHRHPGSSHRHAGALARVGALLFLLRPAAALVVLVGGGVRVAAVPAPLLPALSLLRKSRGGASRQRSVNVRGACAASRPMH